MRSAPGQRPCPDTCALGSPGLGGLPPRPLTATAAHLHVAGTGRALGRRSPGERAGQLVTRAGDRRVSSLCGLRQTLVPAVGRGGGTSCCPLAQPLRCLLEAWPVCRPPPWGGQLWFSDGHSGRGWSRQVGSGQNGRSPSPTPGPYPPHSQLSKNKAVAPVGPEIILSLETDCTATPQQLLGVLQP